MNFPLKASQKCNCLGTLVDANGVRLNFEEMQEAARRANAYDAIVTALTRATEVMRLQPAPQLGDWNWPDIVEECDAALSATKGGAA